MTDTAIPVLQVENLSIAYHDGQAEQRTVHEVSFSIAAGVGFREEMRQAAAGPAFHGRDGRGSRCGRKPETGECDHGEAGGACEHWLSPEEGGMIVFPSTPQRVASWHECPSLLRLPPASPC